MSLPVLRAGLLAVALLSSPAMAGRPDPIETATGVPAKQLVDALEPWAGGAGLTLLHPIPATVVDAFGPAELTLRPVQCRPAFANAHGRLHDCPLRSAHLRQQLGPVAHALRARTALWQSSDGRRSAAFVFYELPPTDGDQALLKALRKRRFAAVPLASSEWAAHIASGRQDVSWADRLDSAAEAAFAATDRGDAYKALHAVPMPAPDQAVVWGELRPESEVTIRKVDGKTTWHVPLNGYAQAVTVPAGAHALRLVFLGTRAPREYEQDLQAALAGGHTYVVSQGPDDRPRIEDLGRGVACERRKRPMLMAAGTGNAWLACTRPAPDGGAAP